MVSYATRSLTLDSGEKLVMRNVIRTVARSTMIAQCLQVFAKKRTFRITEVREASQRKALKGLDNVAADGMAAFETLERLSD